MASCPLHGCRDCFPRASETVDQEDLISQRWIFTEQSTQSLDEPGATKLIGQTMSDVYKAFLRLDGSPPQLCAVKRLKANLSLQAEQQYTIQKQRELEVAANLVKTYERHGLYAESSRLLFVTFLGVFPADGAMHLVMEYMPQGNLLQYLHIPWEEEDTRIVAKQVLLALNFLHKEDITHRNIKAENIFPMLSHDGTLHIKVGDFGASKHVPPGSKGTKALITRIGTRNSAAPEIYFEAPAMIYTSEVDIYSLGTLLFRIRTGKSPFPTQKDYSKAYVEASISNAYVKIAMEEKSGKAGKAGDGLHQALNKTSDEVKALILSMLEFHPKARPSANEALNHNWFLEENHDITPTLQQHFRTVLGNRD